jgi:hypothetical protein
VQKRTLPLAALQQTIAYIFDENTHALAQPFEHWLATSKPFAAFAQSYQSKIRKKVRTARGAEEMYNLYCELRTAYLLLQEPKLAVAYEPYTKQSGRSPDFAVTYRTHTTFHVEVTRLRLSPQEPSGAGERDHARASPEASTTSIRHDAGRRLADAVCAKLGQLVPSTPNVLWLWVQSRVLHELDVEQVMPALKRRAEQGDASLLARYGFRNPAEFIRHYQRLSIVLVQSLHAQAADKDPLMWNNNDARYPLPAQVKNILYTRIRTGNSPDFAAGPWQAS